MYKLQIAVSTFFSFSQGVSPKHFVPYYELVNGEEQKLKQINIYFVFFFLYLLNFESQKQIQFIIWFFYASVKGRNKPKKKHNYHLYQILGRARLGEKEHNWSTKNS